MLDLDENVCKKDVNNNQVVGFGFHIEHDVVGQDQKFAVRHAIEIEMPFNSLCRIISKNGAFMYIML